MAVFKQLIKQTPEKAGFFLRPLRTLPQGIDPRANLERHWAGRSPRVICDVGANIGDTVLDYAPRFPSAEMHAFEPLPPAFATPRCDVGAPPRVHLHAFAPGATDGNTFMEAAPESGTNRLVESGNASLCAEVEICRLDTICAQQGLSHIDLLKTDCEGFDLDVLHSTEDLLSNGVIDCIFGEVNFRRDRGHGDFFAIESYLNPLGYEFHTLYGYSDWNASVGTEGFANALFARRPGALHFASSA